jgi:hypothetical protein
MLSSNKRCWKKLSMHIRRKINRFNLWWNSTNIFQCCNKQEGLDNPPNDITPNLQTMNPSNLEWFSLDGFVTCCRVISVNSLETLILALIVKNKIFKIKCRLEEKKEEFPSSNNINITNIGKRILWIKCGSWDKFGERIFGSIYLNKEDVDKNLNLKWEHFSREQMDEWVCL